MRITALEVDGFGVWSGLKLDQFGDDLTVIYGPNEAGKTTLMQFVRSVLYGFSPERRRYLPPVHGGTAGGSLAVRSSEGRFEISRHLANGSSSAEELVVWAADGTRQGEHILRTLLSSLDEAIFENVFAVGLRELQELATLSDTKAAELLYTISAGLDRVALVEVMHALEQSRNRLLDAGGGPCQITQLIAERQKLRGGQEHSQTAIRRYERLADERDMLQREAQSLEATNHQLQHEVRIAEIALTVRDRWQRRAELDEQLAAFGPSGGMPEGALERLDTLKSRLQRRQERIEHLKDQYQELRAEGAELKINGSLVRLAPRIEALQDQGPWLGSLENRLLELEVEISDLEGKLKADLERLGLGTSGQPQELPKISPRTLRALRQPAEAVRRARQRKSETAQQVEQSQENELALGEQIESALSARGEKDLTATLERSSAQVALLRRRVQLDERLTQMEQYQAELEEQSRKHLDQQLLPAWTLVFLGGLFITGPVLVLLKIVGLLVSLSLTDPISWWHVFMGLLATGSSVGAKAALERMSARRLEACQQQLSMLQSQVQQAKEERETLDKQLPRGGGPLVLRLQTAEQELAGLEEIVPLDSRRQAAQQESQAAGERGRQAEQELTSLRRRWREALGGLGLPKELSPKQVRQLASASGRVREIQQRLERLREEAEQRQREHDGLCGRIRQVVSDAGLTLEKATPQEQIQTLLEQLQEHESRRKRREAIRVQFQKLRRKRSGLEETIRRLKSQRRRLLEQVGVEDEQEFRQRAERLQEVSVLRRERTALAREIEAALGSQGSEAEVGKVLAGEPQERLETRLEQLQQRLQANETELRARFEKRGQVAEQLRLLAEDREPAAQRLELAIVERRLEEAVQRWRSLAVTSQILKTVRTIYERDRQPETLQEASGYLERMTEGRYVRVWTPLGEETLLVDDAKGHSLRVEVLSQGAREQLFLCLRLALANSYGKRGIELPLILDDVLVNFDVRRAKAAAAVLRDFAVTGHQVIVFTCHEHIMKVFESLKVAVSPLPERDAATAGKRKAKPKRPPAEAAPPVVAEPVRAARKPQVEELAPWEEVDDLDEEEGLFDEEEEEATIDEFDEDADEFDEEPDEEESEDSQDEEAFEDEDLFEEEDEDGDSEAA